MKYNIVTYDDDRLRIKSETVNDINKDIKQLVKDMYQMMYMNNGIGLSAVQIGVHLRIFVTDVPKFGKYTMINPEIVNFSDKSSTYEEGCLSIPGIQTEVERPAEISIRYTDLKGKEKTIDASGLLSTCFQHEYDHLRGKLFIDKIDPTVKNKIMKDYWRQQKII